MKVSARALSVSCPHCHRVISLENLRIVGAHPGRALATCGDVRIEAPARLNLAIIGRNVVILGRVRGPVSASEAVEVGPTGHVIGDITAPKIVVQDGAVINGRCQMVAADSLRGGRDRSRDEAGETVGEGAKREGADGRKTEPAVEQAPSDHVSVIQPRPLPRPISRA